MAIGELIQLAQMSAVGKGGKRSLDSTRPDQNRLGRGKAVARFNLHRSVQVRKGVSGREIQPAKHSTSAPPLSYETDHYKE